MLAAFTSSQTFLSQSSCDHAIGPSEVHVLSLAVAGRAQWPLAYYQARTPSNASEHFYVTSNTDQLRKKRKSVNLIPQARDQNDASGCSCSCDILNVPNCNSNNLPTVSFCPLLTTKARADKSDKNIFHSIDPRQKSGPMRESVCKLKLSLQHNFFYITKRQLWSHITRPLKRKFSKNLFFLFFWLSGIKTIHSKTTTVTSQNYNPCI